MTALLTNPFTVTILLMSLITSVLGNVLQTLHRRRHGPDKDV